MSMNWHESYTRSIFTITFFTFRDSNYSQENGSESATSNQEVTIAVANKSSVSF